MQGTIIVISEFLSLFGGKLTFKGEPSCSRVFRELFHSVNVVKGV